jgi:hypothetical protein
MIQQPSPRVPAAQKRGGDTLPRPGPVDDGYPVGVAPRWGVSSLDWRSHAVEEDTKHPDGGYVARRGQHLVMSASLYDEPPGWMCVACLRWTQR